ncbi:hypothetical protein LX32DRAFT_427738 [Colletotrichum zoysiae]|uniref:Secreted protein n=1 Tax=Colletotrichum zoysiae TaxID=1216348 RepID=A0AAD9HGP4_9PEZI|nr:hypothetical protein LX32DRAFT_427738 [Colletotrichum zoysiae]
MSCQLLCSCSSFFLFFLEGLKGRHTSKSHVLDECVLVSSEVDGQSRPLSTSLFVVYCIGRHHKYVGMSTKSRMQIRIKTNWSLGVLECAPGPNAEMSRMIMAENHGAGPHGRIALLRDINLSTR